MRETDRETRVIADVALPHRGNVTVRFSETERIEAQTRADEYAKGNLSAWIRYASTRLVPNETDMRTLKVKK